MAPFVPFLTERLFLQMQLNFNYEKDVKSVHLLDLPTYDKKLIDNSILEEMDFIISFIQDLRALREQVKIKIRQPIKEYMLNLDDEHKTIVENFDSLIKSELNVKELNFITEKKAKSLYSEELILSKGSMGRDFKRDRLKVEKLINSMDLNDLINKLIKGKFKVKVNSKEYEITKEHVNIQQNAKDPYCVKILNYGTILINSEMNEDLLREGFSREFIRNIQNIRKKLNLSRFKEKIIINIKSEIDLEKELGIFIETVKNETGCIKIAREKKGEAFSFNIQNKNIELLIEVKE